MNPLLIVAITVSLLLGAWFGGSVWIAKRKLNKMLSGRSRISDDEFFERFFAGSGIPQPVVFNIREIFQKWIPFDLSRLEADDDLSGDFKELWDLDSMADIQIVVELEKVFDIEITDEEAIAMKSFRSVVSGVWSKIQSK
jgi:acyl carrier protein/uncharacterized protein YneF (UPF0154 family)